MTNKELGELVDNTSKIITKTGDMMLKLTAIIDNFDRRIRLLESKVAQNEKQSVKP
jgi:hypothetical protein